MPVRHDTVGAVGRATQPHGDIMITKSRACPNGHRRRHPLAARVAAAALVVAGSVTAVVVPSGAALAAATADLSVSQRISGGSVSGQTIDTVTVHNAGPATATNVNITSLLTTASSGLYIRSNTGTCQLAPPPSGYTLLATCQMGSIASGHRVKEVFTLSGEAGVAFTNFVTVGAASPADPKWSNNAGTKSSWYGPRADLALTGTAKPGTTSGTAKVVSTVTNRGPSTANALQMIVEIKSPGYSSVLAAGNLAGSCQFIPPASGYDQAVSCVVDALGSGKQWVETFAYTGTAGTSLIVDTSVSANNPTDPVSSNNSNTKSTTYKP